jgi:hypothetical protein
MKPAFILLMGILSIYACGPHMTLMVNPKTGERVECRAGAAVRQGVTIPLDQTQRTNCVEQYESLGFVQAQNLTPEQRDNLLSQPKR